MKNILLVVRWPVGGIRTYLNYVFSGDEFSDAKFTVIAPDVGGLSAQFGTVFSADRFNYIPCENSAQGVFNVVWQQLRQQEFSLINVQGFTSGIAAFIPALLLAGKIPRVLTVHDVLHPVHFSGVKGKIKRWLMAQVFKRYHCVVPVSGDCRDNMLSFLPEVAATKINTINNGVSVSRLTASTPAPLRQQLNVSDDYFLIGFLGRFMAQKGFRYLVDAVATLTQDEAVTRKPLVLCYGMGGFYREEMAAIKARGLEDHFKLFSQVEDVGAVMKSLDVVAMPSLWEACPLLPMEVLICGTPLIASDCIGLREVVANTPAWVVPQADGQALASALKAAMADDRRSEFGAYAPLAAERFAVARTRAEVAALYGELLAGSSA